MHRQDLTAQWDSSAWLLWLLPPLLLLGQLVWQRRQRRRRYQMAHGDLLRSQQARKKAQQMLA